MINLYQGDCLNELKKLPDNSVDSLVTDPPAGISFMGKEWDSDKGGRDGWIKWMSEVMTECKRVMKPGAHGLVWAIPRTSHWTATALEDAGFEVRDVITHLFGSGFPKSLNVLKALEKEYLCRYINPAKDAIKLLKHSLAELREEMTGSVLGNVVILPEGDHAKLMVIGEVVDSLGQTVMFQLESTELISLNIDIFYQNILEDHLDPTRKFITLTKLKTITELKICSLLPKLNTLANICGVGTALKPASEHWVLVRKPLEEKTVSANVLKHGCGGINIDASRIVGEPVPCQVSSTGSGFNKFDSSDYPGKRVYSNQGRFPANLVLSHSPYCQDDQCDIECAIVKLDEQSGVLKSGRPGIRRKAHNTHSMVGCLDITGKTESGIGDSGGASRFFYCAKISSSERNAGLEGMPDRETQSDWPQGGISEGNTNRGATVKNHHPTVKPKKLMSYFIRMITPPNGIVLDPFMGSGSTGIAAKETGFKFIGIEKEPEYFEIASKRING